MAAKPGNVMVAVLRPAANLAPGPCPVLRSQDQHPAENLSTASVMIPSMPSRSRRWTSASSLTV